MAGRRIGTVFVELDLDPSRYTKGQQCLYKDATTTTLNIEANFKKLGIKSSAEMDLMRAKITNSFNMIKNSSQATANDIVRAEKAKNDQLKQLNEQQFGAQTSMLTKLKQNWMALAATFTVVYLAARRAYNVIKNLLSEYGNFEVALNRLGNVSRNSLNSMRDDILKLHPELGKVTELAKGYYQVLSAGVTNPIKSLDLLRVSAKMSKEATIEQSEAVKGIASLMSAYTGELRKATDAADLLYSIEKSGITTVGELTPLVGNLANMARAVGLSANEMAAALAQISTTGAGTSISVTNLQSLLTALSKKFALLPPEVQKYGSSLAAVKAIGFQGVLKEIWEATNGNSTALIKMLGRQEAFLALLQLSKNEFSEYASKFTEMSRKAGAFESAWTRYADTMNASIKTLGNTIERILIPNLESWAGWIKNIAKFWGKLLIAPSMEDVILKNLQNQIRVMELEKAKFESVASGSAMLDKTLGWLPGYITQEEATQGIKLLKARIRLVNTTIAKMKSGEGEKPFDKPSITDIMGAGDTELPPSIDSIKLQEDLSDKIKKLTLDDLDYKKWAMNEEIKTLELKAEKDKSLISMVGEYRRAKLQEYHNFVIEDQEKGTALFEEVLDKYKNIEEKKATERENIQKSLAAKINQLTLNKTDYAIWSLHQETNALKEKHAEDAAMLALITQHHELSLKKIGEKTEETFGGDMKTAITGWASNFSSTLNDMVWEANSSFSDIARSFAKMITQMMIQRAIVEPLLSFMFPTKKAAVQGAVFAGPGITAHENTIVSKPTIFPFATGIGLMGEAGSEAIMPLTRTKSGDLGVKAEKEGQQVNNIQYIDMTDSTFSDQETMAKTMDTISALNVQKYASQVIINDYNRDHPIRSLLRGKA